MAKNIVSKPPLMTPITDSNGELHRAWSIWFRDLYTRTSYKGGNAIDENKAEVDAELLEVNSTLNETIEQVNENIEDISENSSSIASNESAISLNITAIALNATNLSTHEGLEEAHGSNGSIVGFDDLADELIYGLVKRMELLANASATGAGVGVSDASAAPALYSQTHSQELVDLANANKSAINTLASDFNSAITVLNNLIARSKTSGQMTT